MEMNNEPVALLSEEDVAAFLTNILKIGRKSGYVDSIIRRAFSQSNYTLPNKYLRDKE